jgi:3-oxoadipate enol-lactonase
MPHINANGMSLYYEDTGGDGPVVIFSHGLLMNREMFAPQIERLRQTYRCITWDQRGFGKTGPVDRAFTYWTSAQDVLSLMTALNVPKASMVGLSQGGFLAMRAGLLAPERVSALVLLATRSGIDDAQTIDNFRALSAEWKNSGSVNVQGMLQKVLLGPDVDPEPWVSNWRGMGRDDMMYPLDALIGRDDITANISGLTCPSIVVHGTVDIAIDIEHGRHLARNLPGCRGFFDVDGAGHAVNLARPDQVTSVVEAFLAEPRREKAKPE